MTTVMLRTTGAGTWTVPAGVTSVKVEIWGAGGSGAYGSGFYITGGGGGAYSSSTLSVTSGTSISYSIGSQNNSVVGSSRAGIDGGDTWFDSSTTLMAKGGQGGLLSDTALTSGALGGDAASGYGTIKYSGGNAGGSTVLNASSGGGGAAWSGGAGGNTLNGTAPASAPVGGISGFIAGGSLSIGLPSYDGGSGGSGMRSVDNVLALGGLPGGGGGPAGNTPGANAANASYGHGQIKITYSLSVSTPTIVGKHIIAGSDNLTTFTIPAHVADDIIVVVLQRSQFSSTTPALATGWTSIQTGTTSNPTAAIVAYRKATSSAMTSGTWGIFNDGIVTVVRGTTGDVGVSAVATGSSTVIGYPALSTFTTPGHSMVLAIALTAATFGTNVTLNPAVSPSGFSCFGAWQRLCCTNELTVRVPLSPDSLILRLQ